MVKFLSRKDAKSQRSFLIVLATWPEIIPGVESQVVIIETTLKTCFLKLVKIFIHLIIWILNAKINVIVTNIPLEWTL